MAREAPWRRLKIGAVRWQVRLVPNLIRDEEVYGYTDFDLRTMFIDAGLSRRMRTRTLLHELGHVIAGRTPHWRNHHRLLCPVLEQLEPLLKVLAQ